MNICYSKIIFYDNFSHCSHRRYESIDEKCYIESYHIWDWYERACHKANQFVKSVFQLMKSNDNICVDDIAGNRVLEICQYQFNLDTVSLLINNKLFFYTILQNIYKINEFPPELQVKGKIYDVEVDKFSKCIYGHFEEGIGKKCYTTQKELDKQFQLIVMDSNILGIEIDQRTGHYQLYVSYFVKTTNKLAVVILTTSGDEIRSFKVEERVQDMGYFNDFYYVYTESKSMKVDMHNNIEFLVNVYITSGTRYTENYENG
ncbi:hypothetical protein RF11_05400 [Thelohanellus kitauei]|uniref:Uncharacterized protein n=1 Tax=Thelohanellus kitauei TaxID=669202 RepID=A0A0C2MKU4_THEKT|nr:hypothetical protein RF11_05400 [Thelohanellus kitauei]